MLATLCVAKTSGHSVYLFCRGNSIRQHQGILQEGYTQYHADKYHDTDNPNVKNESLLCPSLPQMTQPDMQHIDPALLLYHDWKGHHLHECHTIVDEVYMLTVYEETATFHSRTHVMWGIRLCDGRVCVGTVYSDNRDLVEALDKLWMLHGVPDPIQHQVARLLQDRLRMQAAHRYMTEELQSLGVHYLHQPAGFYIWADLRKYQREPSFVEELSLWRCLLKYKVALSCGQAFHCYTPGWFCIVFTDRHQYLTLGMQRIRKALEETDKATSTPDIGTTNEATEKEGTKMTSKRDTTGSHKAVAVKSTPLPKNSSSSEEPGEKDNPDPDMSHPTSSLDSLIGALRQQIRSSDWLEKNTPELSAGQEPELLDVFKGFLFIFTFSYIVE
uniref:Aminotransferase class I/classII large domain-containing protein n=1 Tax=Oncorhynchus kisutch TaxID=8019 RepID=A0A8C7CYB9_ONCKI